MVWLIRVQRYYKKTGYANFGGEKWQKMAENANFREEKWKKMQILYTKKTTYKKTIYKKNNPPCLTDCFWKNLYCCLIEINDSKHFTTIVLLLRAFIFAVRPGVRI